MLNSALQQNCNTLKHTTTHCDTPQHTAAQCNTLKHTATHCNTLQHTATHRTAPQHNATHSNTPQHTATHRNTPQHTASVIHVVITGHRHVFVTATVNKQCSSPFSSTVNKCYGVASVSRIDKIIGLFCIRALQKRRYSAKNPKL